MHINLCEEGRFMSNLRRKRKLFFSNKGFSLIELMIVVAIIGILATVAIPNFQVFIRRGKQAEAKSNLTTIYSAQRAFHGEWGFFKGAFEHIGFLPEGDLRYRYNTADGGAHPIYDPRKGNQIGAATLDSGAFCGGNPNCVEDTTTAVAAGSAAPAVTGPPNATFLATAGANLGGALADEWSMDQAKALTQAQNGEQN